MLLYQTLDHDLKTRNAKNNLSDLMNYYQEKQSNLLSNDYLCSKSSQRNRDFFFKEKLFE